MSTDPNVVPRPEACSKSADVVFVVDTSIYMDRVQLQTYVIGVIQEIVEHLRVDELVTRVAAVSYSTDAKVFAPTAF